MKNVQQALAAALGLDRFGFYFVRNEIEIPETCGAQQICDDSRLAIRVLVWLPAEDVVDGSRWGWGWSPLWSWIGIAGMDRRIDGWRAAGHGNTFRCGCLVPAHPVA